MKKIAARHHLKEDLVRSIEDLLIEHRRLVEELEDVIYDQEQLLGGSCLYFAVDFHLLFNFAYPYSPFIKRNRLVREPPSAEERFAFLEYQATLSYLFYGLSGSSIPILLPPHIQELQNHLKYEDDQAYRRELTIHTVKSWGTRLLTSKQRKLIEQADQQLAAGRTMSGLPKAVRRELFDMIFEKFTDLILLASGHAEFGMQRLLEVIKENRLRVNLNNLGEDTDVIKEALADALEQRRSHVYDSFAKLRYKRTGENQRDASLVDCVVAVNKRAQARVSNKLRMYLLSNAPTMDMLFHPEHHHIRRELKEELRGLDEDLHPLGPDVRLHRRTTIFSLYMLSIGKRDAQTEEAPAKVREAAIANLKAFRNLLLDFGTIDKLFNEIVERFKETYGRPTNDQLKEYHELADDLSKRIQYFRNRVSLSILLNRESLLGTVMNIDQSETRITSIVESLVRFLQNRDHGFDKELLARRDRLNQLYRKLIAALAERSVSIALSSHEDLVYRLKPLRRIPFSVRFSNELISGKLSEALDHILRPHNGVSPERTKQISREIISLTGREELGPERHLLAGILNYNFGQLDNARKILFYCISDNVVSARREDYILLELLARHQLAVEEHNILLYREAQQDCQKGMDDHPEDPRFKYMFGVILGRGIQGGLEEGTSLDPAIAKFEEALAASAVSSERDPVFEATVHNSIAFAIFMKRGQNELDVGRAVKAIGSMRELVNEDDWDAHFIDTKGCVKLMQARHELSSPQRSSLGNEAVDLLERAHTLSLEHKYLGYETKSISEHLNEAKLFVSAGS